MEMVKSELVEEREKYRVLSAPADEKEADSIENEIVVNAPVADKIKNNRPVELSAEEKLVFNNGRPSRSKVKCEYCERKLPYDEVVKHCRETHPEKANFVRKYCCSCFSKVPSCIWEYHQLIFHGTSVQKKNEEDVPPNIKLSDKVPYEENLRLNCRKSKIKCGFCESELSYREFVPHCKKWHPEANLQGKNCDFCTSIIPSCIWEFHQLNYHQNAEQQKRSNEVAPCYRCGKLMTTVNLKRHIRRDYQMGKHSDYSFMLSSAFKAQ